MEQFGLSLLQIYMLHEERKAQIRYLKLMPLTHELLLTEFRLQIDVSVSFMIHPDLGINYLHQIYHFQKYT